MSYHIYYYDDANELQSPGETALTSDTYDDAVREFRRVATELYNPDEGWTATEYAMTDGEMRVLETFSVGLNSLN